MNKFILKNIFPALLLAGLFFFSSCKKTADTPAAELPERLEIITPGTSMLPRSSVQMSVKFYDSNGQEMSVNRLAV